MRLLKVAGLLVLLLISSCTSREIPSIDRQDLFSISIGRLEDQVDLFDLEARQRSRKTRIVMRDGIVFIADGNGAKVVRYTSYGDLLSMIYDPETNPSPLTLKTDVDAQDVVTRRAISYPLCEPGELAVNSLKHIYVEDRLPAERRSYDREHMAQLDSVVLHFDQDGKFLEYLGREGIGGSPFPLIQNITVSSNDDLVVVCRLTQGWNIYWFDKDGNLLYLVQLNRDELPMPQGKILQASVDTIVPAPDARRLYLKIDYYSDMVDNATSTHAGITYDSSLIWTMEVKDGSYTKKLEIPAYDRIEKEHDKEVASPVMYSLLGAASGGRFFLYAPEDGGYSLLLMEEGSKNQKKGFIHVSNDELMFNSFNLSSDGILCALLATEFDAKVVWWRTDKFWGEPHP